MKKLGFGLMRLPLINGEFDRIDKESRHTGADFVRTHRS